MESSILGIPTQDPILMDIFKYDIQYTHITGDVNLCVNRCGQSIEDCDEVHLMNMTNVGKVMTLNPNPSKAGSSKCYMKKAFDEDGESMSQYKFEKIFVMTPSYHKIDTVVYDAEIGIVFSKFDRMKKKKYMVLSVLANNRIDVDPKSLASTGDLLFYKLTNELFGDPNKVPTLFSKKEISYPPNPVRIGDFLPPVGDRSFYEYSYNYAANVTYRIFQRPMVISAPVLKNLQEKLTPDKLYQQFKQALIQYENPKKGLVIFYKQDTEKPAAGKKEGFEGAANGGETGDGGDDGNDSQKKRIEEVVEREDAREAAKKRRGKKDAEKYESDFDDDGDDSKNGKKIIEGFPDGGESGASGDEPIAGGKDTESYDAEADPDLDDGTPLAALAQMTSADYDPDQDPDILAERAKEAEKERMKEAKEREKEAAKQAKKEAKENKGKVVESLSADDEEILSATSTEGKDVMVLLVVGMIAIIFSIFYQVFLSYFVNNPAKDYYPDEKLMRELQMTKNRRISLWLYFGSKIVIYLFLVISLILYLAAVGLGAKYNFVNDVLIGKKSFMSLLRSSGILLVFMFLFVLFNLIVRLFMNHNYYDKISVLDSFLNIDALILWMKVKNPEGTVEGECLTDEQLSRFQLSTESVYSPGAQAGTGAATQAATQAGAQAAAQDDDIGNNFSENLKQILTFRMSKFMNILLSNIFVISAFIMPLTGLDTFTLSPGKYKNLSPTALSNLFKGIIRTLAVFTGFALFYPVVILLIIVLHRGFLTLDSIRHLIAMLSWPYVVGFLIITIVLGVITGLVNDGKIGGTAYSTNKNDAVGILGFFTAIFGVLTIISGLGKFGAFTNLINEFQQRISEAAAVARGQQQMVARGDPQTYPEELGSVPGAPNGGLGALAGRTAAGGPGGGGGGRRPAGLGNEFDF